MKYQKATDKNEKQIIKDLTKFGCVVKNNHDDLLVYYKDQLYQIEIKVRSPFQQNGTIETGFIKDNQYELLCTANDFYFIAWTSQQIIDRITNKRDISNPVITPSLFDLHFKKWLSDKELIRLRGFKWWSCEWSHKY